MTINVGGNVDFERNYPKPETQEQISSTLNSTMQLLRIEDEIKAFSTDYDIFDQGYRTNAGPGISFNETSITSKSCLVKTGNQTKRAQRIMPRELGQYYPFLSTQTKAIS